MSLNMQDIMDLTKLLHGAEDHEIILNSDQNDTGIYKLCLLIELILMIIACPIIKIVNCRTATGSTKSIK